MARESSTLPRCRECGAYWPNGPTADACPACGAATEAPDLSKPGERAMLALEAAGAFGLPALAAVILARHAYRDGGGGSWESPLTMARVLKRNRTAIVRANGQLIEAGLIARAGSRRIAGPGGPQAVTVYRVNRAALKGVADSDSLEPRGCRNSCSKGVADSDTNRNKNRNSRTSKGKLQRN